MQLAADNNSGAAGGFRYKVSHAILIQVYGILWSKFGYKVFSLSRILGILMNHTFYDFSRFLGTLVSWEENSGYIGIPLTPWPDLIIASFITVYLRLGYCFQEKKRETKEKFHTGKKERKNNCSDE